MYPYLIVHNHCPFLDLDNLNLVAAALVYCMVYCMMSGWMYRFAMPHPRDLMFQRGLVYVWNVISLSILLFSYVGVIHQVALCILFHAF